MTFSEPYRYTLTMSNATDGTDGKRLLGKVNYHKAVTQKGVPKIYVVQAEGKVVYVGYASQSMGTRMGQGFRGSKGYQGYKWRFLEQVELLVFVSDTPLTGDESKDAETILLGKAIEAELVHLVRTKTKKWPEWQNEIHFNNYQREKALKIAIDMYNMLN